MKVYGALLGMTMGWASVCYAGDIPEAIHQTKTDGSVESGWVVLIPAGSSDYFNVRYDVAIDTAVSGLSVSIADFGTTNTFPQYGMYESNLGLDATGGTPDLSTPLTEGFSPVISTSFLFDHCDLPLPLATIPAGSSAHAVVQLPPGDPGLLGVGADTDVFVDGGDETVSPNPFDSSGFTTNGYSTAGAVFANGDFALNPVIDACEYVTNSPGTNALRLMRNCSDLTGDFETITVGAGGDFGFHILGASHSGAQALGLIMFSSGGVPVSTFGSAIPLADSGDGCTASIRACGTWPCGVGGLTFNFVSITGCVGVSGSAQISNEVTVITLPDPPADFAPLDDGSYESGWVVQIPGGSSDYFSTLFLNAGPGTDSVCGIQVSVLDFGASVNTFPSSGFAPPNVGLDPSGISPDLSNPYVNRSITFPPLTFVTTSSALVTESFPPFVPAGDITAFIQLPPGDAGLLGVGSDTNTTPSGQAGFTLDGFTTPATPFSTNFGIRVR